MRKSHRPTASSVSRNVRNPAARGNHHGLAAAVLLIVAVLLPVGTGALRGIAAASHDGNREQVVSVDAATLERVRSFVESERQRAGFPGMSVAIVVGDRVVLAEGFGEAHLGQEAMAESSVTLIASLSKSVTALTLMTLVDEGIAGLDDPISMYVPETAPNGERVTLRQLMHHRSGISRTDGTAPFVGETGTSLERNATRFGPLLEPGAGFEYSNANYDALALVIERVTGRPFPEVVADRVFGPSGMRRSVVGSAGAASPDLATGYYHRLFLGYGEHEPWMPDGLAGSYLMFSSADDIARLMRVHLGHSDGQVVSPESLAVLHEPVQFGPDDWPVGYAGGLRVFPAGQFGFPGRLADLTWLGHDGSSPSYRSAMAMLPEAGLGVAVFANANNDADETAVPQITDNILLLLLGEQTFEVTALSDTLTRWRKHLLALTVTGQIALAALSVFPLRRLRQRRSPKWRGWSILGVATALDIVALVVLIVVIPSVGEAPLRVVRSLPDYGLLITAIMIGVGWGTLRTALASYWTFTGRQEKESYPIADGASA